MTRNRLLSIDVLRIIASFFVVMIHTAALGFYTEDPHSSQWMAKNFYDSYAQMAVPVFFMISGASVLQKKEITVSYSLKKILRFLLLWLFFYLFYRCAEVGFKNVLQDPMKLILKITSSYSPKYHLWYLIDLSLIYFLLPFIHNNVKDRKLIHYYIILFLTFSVILTTISRSSFVSPVIKAYLNPYRNLQCVGYMGYFIMGWYLITFLLDKIEKKKLLIIFFILLFIICGLFTSYLNRSISINNDKAETIWYNHLTFFMFLEAVSFYMLVLLLFGSIHKDSTHAKIISVVSPNTLFIYLIHPFLIDIFRSTYKIYPPNYNSWISIPVFTLLYWGISLLLGIIIRKIPFINRWI